MPLKPLTWKLAQAKLINKKGYAAIEPFISAQVPGAIQSDIAREKKYPDFRISDHYKQFLWMEDEFFLYRTEFNLNASDLKKNIYFYSKGIDYQFDIFLNGRCLHSQEGMFTPVQCLLSPHLAENNQLDILIHPIPKATRDQDRSQARKSAKPAVSYGWDWHPRLVTRGIWDDSGLLIHAKSHILDASIHSELSSDLKKAQVHLELQTKTQEGEQYEIELLDPEGRKVYQNRQDIKSEETQISFSLAKPRLWWPWQLGPSERYTWTVNLLSEGAEVLDSKSGKCAFRRTELRMNEGAWETPKDFPKGRSPAPISLYINNRFLFVKGSNWVHPDIFIGDLNKARYKKLLTLAKEANLNLLRVWGGGIVNKDSFHELCDDMGLLVWQEFPLACNDYPDDEDYLQVLSQEAKSIIKNLRTHPSTALYCGGNELFNAWSGMDDQSLALRRLGALCLEHDPLTPFLPTSPVFGMAHGHYVFYDEVEKEEVFTWMKRAKNTAYTEYGISSPSDVAILEKIIPENMRWPIEENEAWTAHHGFDAWVKDSWLCLSIQEKYFGKVKNLKSLVENGQKLQGAGLRFIFEEARRQAPYCSMAINWCFNEPWPTAANTSIIQYPAKPKRSYNEVKLACRSTCFHLALEQIEFTEGEMIHLPLGVFNDSDEILNDLTLSVYLKQGKKTMTLGQWTIQELKAWSQLSGPILRFKAPTWSNGWAAVVLECPANPKLASDYDVLLKNKVLQEKASSLNF